MTRSEWSIFWRLMVAVMAALVCWAAQQVAVLAEDTAADTIRPLAEDQNK